MNATENVKPRPIPGAGAFAELQRKRPGMTCWASCEPDAPSREHDARAFLMLPCGRDPAAYFWPVLGREVVLIGTGASDRRILATCRALLRNGALKIVIVHGESWRTPHLSVVTAKAVRHAA